MNARREQVLQLFDLRVSATGRVLDGEIEINARPDFRGKETGRKDADDFRK
jgi:hypothetical protein